MRDPLPHVLVVDDDASIREALGAALGHAYAVHAAATGDEACAVLRRLLFRTHPCRHGGRSILTLNAAERP